MNASSNDDQPQALIYLRVSTAQQAATDRDNEGYSIAAQREACLRKATDLGAVVIEQYVDAGESARSQDRPALQHMLKRLSAGGISYVIVHKVDRLARNRADDALINLDIKAAGAQLVSVTENIDATPSGTLVHGIMSSIAEFYSQNLGAEVKKGMNQKAKKGAYPGKAPLGYRNVVEHSSGHEVRTIEVDPERAIHITWAFETYAQGELSARQLADELSRRGFTTKGTTRKAPGPVDFKWVARTLRNRFYIGIFVWGGVEYDGRHEPLIDQATFDQVQAILDSRDQTAEKARRHNHYLKSTIVCGRCKSRLCFGRSKGRRGDEYDYFFCASRHAKRNGCDLPYLAADRVEDAIERYYNTVRLTSAQIVGLRDQLLAALQLKAIDTEAETKRWTTRIEILEAQRQRLMAGFYEDAVPVDLMRQEQARINVQLVGARDMLTGAQVDWSAIERNLDQALALAANCESSYLHARPMVRR